MPSRAVVAPFFMLDYADRKLVDPRRGAHSRLSFALQLGMGGSWVPSWRIRWKCRGRWWSAWPISWGVPDASVGKVNRTGAMAIGPDQGPDRTSRCGQRLPNRRTAHE